jgi:hypothetical protein
MQYIEILKLLAIYKMCNYRLSVFNCDRYTDVRDRLSVGAGRIRGWATQVESLHAAIS